MKTCAEMQIVHSPKSDYFLDLSFLEGKKILKVGVLEQDPSDGQKVPCDIAVDYEDGEVVRRVVLFCTRPWGLCLAWKGEVGKPNPEDILRQKLKVLDTDVFVESIRDCPLNRSYSFLDGDGNEVFSLGIGELKLMGEVVMNHFTSGKRDDEKAILAVSLWAVS